MADQAKLYRVILQVTDLRRAEGFYSTLLGMKGRSIRGARHYFDCGPVILALVDPAGEGAKAKPTPDYVYFSVAKLGPIHARARELGCLARERVHGEPAGEIVRRPWGERSFYVRDPFGNRLCFVEESTVFTGRQIVGYVSANPAFTSAKPPAGSFPTRLLTKRAGVNTSESGALRPRSSLV